MLSRTSHALGPLRSLSRALSRPAAALHPTSSAHALRTPAFSHLSSLPRSFSSTPLCRQQPHAPQSTPTISQDLYDEVADRDMETLHENLEIFCEQYGKDDWEVEYSSGVLNLTLPPYGTYVLNKQPPNLQIWLSSPLSGPNRFEFQPASVEEEEEGVWEGVWVSCRDGERLGGIVERELRGILKEVEGPEGWEGVGMK
ncbi:iron donor protein CyaY [Cryptococcus amylolentus CBS 6039]|uniref:ferroxidase n=2 Tax=Cryptococcus amylolentus TaxID=104669 RepID=A0A1E3I999_9TREE|nr:iron donor protein CyaY [Cryptococcus amylolentus CBS 6039]ODN84965.1 iron donor protein CyaY [Cryptococcus amylolentus CBS 6039]ODO11337.1 iron donor protein CyaY [Cryptococcus amylolentus CBS 6273]